MLVRLGDSSLFMGQPGRFPRENGEYSQILDAEPRDWHATTSDAFCWPKLVTRLSLDLGNGRGSWIHHDRSVQGAGAGAGAQ